MRSPSTGAVEDFSSALFPGLTPVGGLRMSREPEPTYSHLPVMAAEVVALVSPVPPGVVIDATVGGGGHAAAILAARPDLSVIGLDRDPEAIAATSARLAPFGDRVSLHQVPFDQLGTEAAGHGRGAAAPVAVLFDLGVSSAQIDQAGRGFSLRREGPLDMRMDPGSGPAAAGLVNDAPEAELVALFVANGEGRLARRLARAIVAHRPISTTTELAEVVAGAVPAAVRRRGHPATRVFQALRIAVNEELGQLERALPVALGLVAVGGRVLVIAYHSGEDRLVKGAFAAAATGGCVCPPGLPCVCGAVVEHRLVFRGARKPSAAEIARNPRATSARLRAIERFAPAGGGATERGSAP